MSNPLAVSISPHIRSHESTRKIMWSVIAALVPAGAWGVWAFGFSAAAVIAVSITAAVATEAAILAIRRKEIAIFDGSALLTGLLLAYNLPPDVPLWLPAAGSFFAIAIGKQVFGGLGNNIFNPALIGRAFLLTSWPVYMTTWKNPRWWPDAVTTATPLGILKEEGYRAVAHISKADLFIGNRAGCIGEICIVALLAGAAYLFYKGYITWHIPVTYVASVALLSWAFNGDRGIFTGDVLFFLLTGGLVLGAFFMATDYVTSPVSIGGRLVFGIGCGCLTFFIRKFAGYPEGVSYSILIMNAFAPTIDRYTFPKWYGQKK